MFENMYEYKSPVFVIIYITGFIWKLEFTNCILFVGLWRSIYDLSRRAEKVDKTTHCKLKLNSVHLLET